MTKKFDLLVFDWDGTLMDSAAAIVTAIQAACTDLHLTVPSDEDARYVIGLGLEDALHHVVPQLNTADYPYLVERYRHHYLSSDHALKLFPGVPDMFEWLAGQDYLLAVATGKSRVGLQRALAQSGLTPYFHTTRCADQCFSKPHPAMLEEIMAELDVEPARTLMIGDTVHDLQMARNAGVAALGVTFGAHTADALEAEVPLACLERPVDLHEWLCRNG